jgi:hypothetical protein
MLVSSAGGGGSVGSSSDGGASVGSSSAGGASVGSTAGGASVATSSGGASVGVNVSAGVQAKRLIAAMMITAVSNQKVFLLIISSSLILSRNPDTVASPVSRGQSGLFTTRYLLILHKLNGPLL